MKNTRRRETFEKVSRFQTFTVRNKRCGLRPVNIRTLQILLRVQESFAHLKERLW
jgi:hypothetical protein